MKVCTCCRAAHRHGVCCVHLVGMMYSSTARAEMLKRDSSMREVHSTCRWYRDGLYLLGFLYVKTHQQWRDNSSRCETAGCFAVDYVQACLQKV